MPDPVDMPWQTICCLRTRVVGLGAGKVAFVSQQRNRRATKESCKHETRHQATAEFRLRALRLVSSLTLFRRVRRVAHAGRVELKRCEMAFGNVAK